MRAKLLLGILAALLLTVWSCRKELGLNETDTEVPPDFWAYHPKTTKGQTASGSRENRPTLLRGMADLQKMKETKAFEKYVSRLGRPAWDKSFEFPSLNEVSTLLVPVINDEKKSVTAIVVMTYAGKFYKYHVVKRGKYPKATGKNAGKKLMPARSWDHLFSALDKEFYGKGPSKGLVAKDPNKTTVKYWEYVGYICWHWCLNDGTGNCIENSPTWGYDCADIYVWIWEDDENEPNGSEGGGSGEILVCESCPTGGIIGVGEGGSGGGGDGGGGSNEEGGGGICSTCPTPQPPVDTCRTSKEDLKLVFPNSSDAVLEELANILNKYSRDFGIDTKEKLQHFISQAGHESAGFQNVSVPENLNYSAEKLLEMWPSRFSRTDPSKANPNAYAHNPEKIANLVYGNRIGNGNAASGDGYKYRGRSILQLSGKANYQSFQNFYNSHYSNKLDLISNPDLLISNHTIGVLSGLWYYKAKVMDKITVNENTTVDDVTLKINGGDNGIKDRKTKFNSARTSIDCNN